MSKTELQILLRFFKALGNESRLRILGFLANRECSVEELATLLDLKEPTISHHLSHLKGLNLVTMHADGNTHLYCLNAAGLEAINKDIFSPEHMAALVNNPSADTWEQKVLQSFLDEDRLTNIPTSRKKRAVILKWLVDKFEMGVCYPEATLNEIIQRHHPDSATLRRELIGSKLMARESGIYWRLPEPPTD